jgi:two-component system, NtrC family, sensor histidine kinase HydH
MVVVHHMGIETVSLIIAAFVNGSLGIAAFMRNYRSRTCISFALLAAGLFAHDTFSVIESFDSVNRFASPRLHILSILLLGPASLWWLKELLPIYQKNLRKLLWAYVPLTGILLLAMRLTIYPRLAPWVFYVAHLLFVIPAGVWMLSLAQAQKTTLLTRERVRLRYAFWGAITTLVFYLTDAFHFAGYAAPPLGTLARVLYLMFLFQTFIQKELVTSEEVVAKIALFGSVALILSIIYAMLVSWVGDRPDLFFFNTLIASFVILVLFDPIRNLTTRFTRKLFLRRNLMVEDELNALSVDLMGLVEPIEISRRISASLRRALGMETVALYLLERDGLTYVRFSPDEKSRLTGEISSSNPLVEYMTIRRGRPFVIETIENDRDSFHSAQPRKFCQACLDTMRTIASDFVIPFLHESKLIGFCTASTGERIILSNEQLRLFIPVSRQIALLLKNAQTFTYLRDRDKLAAVGEMAAGLAHEIKNPLGAIKGAAQLLKEDGAPSERREDFLNIILAETDRLSVVLSDFLDYAKPRRNQPQISCDPIRVIEHTAAMTLRDSRVALEIVSESQGLTIEADPEILKQVLLNLFLNAVQAMEDFSPNPKLWVRIREIHPRTLFSLAESLPLHKVWEGWEARKVSTQHAFIEIEVSDNGGGILPEDRDRIFLPFYTTKPKGTGLGLSICQRLVESMGGTINVKANQPRGTTFTIHLPLRREETREFNDPKPRPKESTL